MAEAVFQEALRKFKRRLTTEERQDYQNTTLEQVKTAIKKIQDDREQSKSMVHFDRIRSFLEAMEQFTRVVEVFLNTSSILCFVWGPLKFMLLTAKSHTDELDLLLERYEQIGEQIPLVERYGKLFEHCPEMKNVLGWIFSDILEFHQGARRVFDRPVWRQAVRSAWKDFETRFDDILARLARHSQHLARQAALIHYELYEDNSQALQTQVTAIESKSDEILRFLHQAEQTRLESLRRLDIVEQDRKRKRFQNIMEWIQPEPIESFHESLQEARAKHGTEGRWILEQEQIKNWMVADPPRSSVLWLNGGPGTGKTVAASVIIDECMSMTSSRTAYFYCDEDRSQSILLLRTLLAQLIFPEHELMQFIWDRSSGHLPILQTVSLARRFLLALADGNAGIFLIVDGIDECDPKQRRDIIATLTGIVADTDARSPGKVRLLIVSQMLGDVHKHLSAFPSVSIARENNEGDIRTYVHGELKHCQQKFVLTDGYAHEAAERIVRRADGMFLYATLVTDNLAQQYNREMFMEELKVLPRKLKDAYDRIIYRMRRDLGAQWDMARKLLGWMVCAKRPLRWREVQSIVSIDVEAQTIDFQLKALRVGVHDLCGSLVRVRAGHRIQLVHSTAKSYISESDSVRVDLVGCELAALCLHYLTFNCFRQHIDESETRQYVESGAFALQDYVAAKWMQHVQDLLQLSPETFSQPQRDGRHHEELLAIALDDFVYVFQDELPDDDIESKTLKDCEKLKETSMHEEIVRVWDCVRKHQSAGLDTRNTIIPPSLSDAVARSRGLLEKNNDRSFSLLTEYYGTKLFKCPKVTCFYFHEGFSSDKSRDKHVKQHDRPFRCSVDDCSSTEFGFASNTQLDKHMRQFHADQCDPALSFSLAKPTPEKTPFSCHQCDKKFTRKINLDSHLRNHSGEKPYECKECGRAFTRINDCRRHEKNRHHQ